MTDIFGLIALLISGAVWFRIISALFTHAYNEAVLWQIFSNAFSLAPLAFVVSLGASFLNIYIQPSSHLPNFALLTSLPTSGVWLAQRLPDGAGLGIALVFFFIPAIFSALIFWLANVFKAH
ncbi:hypothetical protein [Methylovulum sp.]|uniref:hypothetical protein n=1 Tax=Methylovulum sp. TaxID=1916980 RepID=UPI002616B73C|nr:hypothetical protein [Methylovulum sp.]MDD5125822.1 hypothetical protein [Methylovulum sp.]